MTKEAKPSKHVQPTATLIVRDAAKLTPTQAEKVIDWAIDTLQDVLHNPDDYSRAFTARYYAKKGK
jgi:hypothetical protein